MSLKLKLAAATLVGSMAATTAYAQNNNTGDIVVQGVLPGQWELTVYDINSGYDFDLAVPATTAAATQARVGTIHVFSNDLAGVGSSGSSTTTVGHLSIESANNGRLINDQSMPGIAADNLRYQMFLQENAIAGTNTAVSGVVADPAGAGATTALADTTAFSLVAQQFVEFTSSASGAVAEATYDVVVQLGDGTADNFPEASGVYSDTITFTIMDDGS